MDLGQSVIVNSKPVGLKRDKVLSIIISDQCRLSYIANVNKTSILNLIVVTISPKSVSVEIGNGFLLQETTQPTMVKLRPVFKELIVRQNVANP